MTRKAPGFAAAAMATLALGVGVSTAMFSMMGAKIAFGRDFTDPDGQLQARMEPVFPPPEGAVAILSTSPPSGSGFS
jgi:hypothetical protein